MQSPRRTFLPLLVALAACGLVGFAAVSPLVDQQSSGVSVERLDARLSRHLDDAVSGVNHVFATTWAEQHLEPAAPADSLTVLRRLSLALVGTIPSLEEIRQFESDTSPDRLHQWTVRLLSDPRFNDYFAERLTVALVGEHTSQDPDFSRTRLEAWVSERLAAGAPYDELVRQLIAEDGPPTSHRAANFITAELVAGESSANRLAARSARTFLGQRIDCAECHDHPFDDWKQADFQGLAAWFAQVRQVPTGITDDADLQYEVEDRKTLGKYVVEPRVPFGAEWLGEHAERRRRFANWITHADNERFWRAIANRVWGLMFGRPFVSPVDALPDPSFADSATQSAPNTQLLDVLAADLREHGGDLRRLVLVIASSKPFLLASSYSTPVTDEELQPLLDTWAVFPLVQLRPEQFARSLLQAETLRPLPPEPNIVARVHRLKRLYQYLDQTGRLGETELDERTESISQTLRRMQGRFVRESSRANWSHAAGQIAVMSTDSTACLEACYLVCLGRRPTSKEQQHFLSEFEGRGLKAKARVVEDIFWTLFNSPEFGWNH